MPIIAITADFEDDGRYSIKPYFAIRQNYITAIEKLGATVIILPYSLENIDNYLNMIDGLVLTGGNFDIHPKLYGDESCHDTVQTKDERTEFEFSLTKQAINKNLPILGICGGMQLINVVEGGSLIQHIPDEVENYLEHEVKPYDQSAHDVMIEEDSMLYKIVKTTKIGANSSHHQAVKQPGKNIKISGRASDGVVESIEHINHPFCIGVEWHPEYEVGESDTAILQALVNATTEYGKNKNS
jgi:putative glutamine amidotransferase